MDPVLAAAIFVLGLTFGSFLNVCIYRLPRDLSVVFPRSTCPGCHNLIRAYDNVPVLSWLILRGRCRHCKTHISPRYLIVEILTGAIFLACYAHFGASLATLKYCALGFLLLGLIFTDAETQLLPDKMTLPGLALGLLFSLVVPVNDLASQLLSGPGSLARELGCFLAFAVAGGRCARRHRRRFVHLRRRRDLPARTRRGRAWVLATSN